MVFEKRDFQLAVSTEMLKQQAKIVVTPTNTAFRASDGWAKRFKRCHNLVMRVRTSMAQKLPGDLESKVQSFKDKVRSVWNRTDIDYRLLGNMDETPVFFDIVPGQAVDVKGRKAERVRTTGAEKHHFTVVLSCTANGDILPPMIIFKGKTRRSIKVLKAPEGVIIAHQERGEWMLKWLDGVWNKKLSVYPESLLKMDSFMQCTLH